jgi:hypothetical protein
VHAQISLGSPQYRLQIADSFLQFCYSVVEIETGVPPFSFFLFSFSSRGNGVLKLIDLLFSALMNQVGLRQN